MLTWAEHQVVYVHWRNKKLTFAFSAVSIIYSPSSLEEQGVEMCILSAVSGTHSSVHWRNKKVIVVYWRNKGVYIWILPVAPRPWAVLAINVGQGFAYIDMYIACLWSELVYMVELWQMNCVMMLYIYLIAKVQIYMVGYMFVHLVHGSICLRKLLARSGPRFPPQKI